MFKTFIFADKDDNENAATVGEADRLEGLFNILFHHEKQ